MLGPALRSPSSHPRIPSQLNPSVEKNLLGYTTLASAAGVGVLALTQPSEAKIVYTPTHQTIASGTTLHLISTATASTIFLSKTVSTDRTEPRPSPLVRRRAC